MDVQELVADLAGLLGLPTRALRPSAPLASPQEVSQLVRDFMAGTVGMGIDLPR